MTESQESDYEKVYALYGETHKIKMRPGCEVNLQHLNDNESVCMGDGESYHWLLIKNTPSA